jgi:hypothetical protein
MPNIYVVQCLDRKCPLKESALQEIVETIVSKPIKIIEKIQFLSQIPQCPLKECGRQEMCGNNRIETHYDIQKVRFLVTDNVNFENESVTIYSECSVK